MRKLWIPLILILSLGLVPGCKDPLNNGGEESQEEIELKNTYLYVNTFTRNMMNLYYLWNAEIKDGIDSWEDTDEPIAKVADIRYHRTVDGKRADTDRWTKLYDDFSTFVGRVSGYQKTYGFDFSLYVYDSDYTSACAVVTLTYADSPARKAGLQRGDTIVKVNGKTLPLVKDKNGNVSLSSQATQIITDELMGGDSVEITLHGGKTVKMNALQMYEDPVVLSRVFDCGGKKVGYLVYTSFTMDSGKDLVRVAKELKAEGIQELILDLRYNGGGYTFTERVLASILAPEAVVTAGNVLATEVYNAGLTEYYRKNNKDTDTYFEVVVTDRDAKGEVIRSCSTEGANLGISKLYAIVGSSSASASEAILCDLYPYMDITLVGQQTHGKFCSGFLMEGPEFYDDYADQLDEDLVKKGKQYTDNWGLYVMVSRFADKDGVTRCMPDGLAPDVKVSDSPVDGCQLGDPQESMLAEALKLCGYISKTPAARKMAAEPLPFEPLPGIDPFRPEFGLRIILP